MTDRLVFNPLDSLEAETSAINTINGNFSALQSFLDTLLSLDGAQPNQMNAILDMNGQEIINLPAAVNPTDPVRLEDLQQIINAGPPGLTTPLYAVNNLSDLTSTATGRTNLGVAIGTNVQAYSAALTALAALTTTTFGTSLLTLANAAALQALLTLGNSATRNVGQSPGTVAAGDDSRFTTFPWNEQLTGTPYTFQASDLGGMVYSPNTPAKAWTIPPYGTTPFSNGATILCRAGVNSANVVITRGAAVFLSIAGSTTNQDITMAAGGICTLVQESTNIWVGAGINLS